jgi:hypothetical protein
MLGAHPENPELRQIVVEASHALARLDADRLEELSLSCQALNRDLASGAGENGIELARQSREAVRDMALFARVLEVTRANVNVMSRLRALRTNRLEYGQDPESGPVETWTSKPAENRHGNN